MNKFLKWAGILLGGLIVLLGVGSVIIYFRSCHGLTMSSGDIPGLPASWPAAPNLTFGPGSALP